MSRAAFPAFCEQAEFASQDLATKHYEESGFSHYDEDADWTLMRRGVFEAYIRPANKMRIGWLGSIIQLSADGQSV